MRTELRVRFHELDPNGHVNHGVYLHWFETARIEAMDALGLGLETLRERGVHLVVTEANVRFRRPAMAGDVVVVETEIRELRRATSWWHQRVVRDGEVLADVDVRSGSVDADGRPVAAPQDVVAVLRPLCAPATAAGATVTSAGPAGARPAAGRARVAPAPPR